MKNNLARPVSSTIRNRYVVERERERGRDPTTLVQKRTDIDLISIRGSIRSHPPKKFLAKVSPAGIVGGPEKCSNQELERANFYSTTMRRGGRDRY